MVGVKILIVSLLVGISAYHFFSSETISYGMVYGKRVLVTGSSTGIGEQIAYQFAQMGAHLVLTARREQRLQEVTRKCLELGASSADYVVSDMTNLTSAQEVAQIATKKLGSLDYLVLNHIGGSGSFGTFQGDMDSLLSSMTVNFLSYVQLTATALSALKQSNGSIVIMSSLSGRFGAPFTTSYCAAKFALEGFYSSLRRECSLQKNNISVTVAVLGFIDTENAVKKVGDKVTMTASPKEDCAKEVVKAAVLRQSELFYPYWSIKPLVLLKDWAPEFMGSLLDKFYVLENIK
ncbi:LOW QUALITY PROTEIN: hydroxysteroid 11-beta-dehydrogenase 1-like protein A [Spea bombifrons]|uniref:LOW QUALITY PROTEIN: hydroxysteroid 11-beta-dehydrogenase 1-like protein A n=1 Tax=Spea bombifrons TaxID=233779 RepID=UPI002349BCEC|nr:LOW QUALITY PROTEIN: hydroxysteroid 11-beta-dehydrogenase 1-like protein A [Spea bombifrons]